MGGNCDKNVKIRRKIGNFFLTMYEHVMDLFAFLLLDQVEHFYFLF